MRLTKKEREEVARKPNAMGVVLGRRLEREFRKRHAAGDPRVHISPDGTVSVDVDDSWHAEAHAEVVKEILREERERRAHERHLDPWDPKDVRRSSH